MSLNSLQVHKSFLITLLLIKFSYTTKTGQKSAQQAAQETSEAVQIIQQHIQSKDMCIENYFEKSEVEEDAEALQLYINNKCPPINKQATGAYIEKIFGKNRGMIGSGSYANAFLFHKDSTPEVQWEAKVYKSTDPLIIFSELNTSACIKKKVDPELYINFGQVLYCVRDKNNKPLVFLPRYRLSIKTLIEQGCQKPFHDRSLMSKINTLILMEKMALTLNELHKNSISHQDLTPAHIFIGDEASVNFVDFGPPKVIPLDLNQQKQSGLYMDYQLIDKTRCDPSAHDIYSLGLIFYEMIYGRQAHSKLIALLTSGSINNQANNESIYIPEPSILEIPSEFDWILKMLSSAIDAFEPRLDIEQVIQNIGEMLARYQEEEKQLKNVHQNVNTNLDHALDNLNDQSSIRMTVDSNGTVDQSVIENAPAFQAMMDQFNQKNYFGGSGGDNIFVQGQALNFVRNDQSNDFFSQASSSNSQNQKNRSKLIDQKSVV